MTWGQLALLVAFGFLCFFFGYRSGWKDRGL